MDGVYPGCLRQDVYVELCSLILEGVFILKQSAGRVHERCQKKHATQIKRKIMMPKAARLQPSNSGGLRGAGRNRLLLGLGCSPSHQPSWLCRRRTCCVASSMSVSSFCQLYCSPEPCSCEPRLWLQESDGDWLQTQVTAEVTVSDYRKTAKSFFCAFHGSCPVSLPTEVSQVLMPLVFYSTSVFVLQKGWRGNSLVLCESLNIFSKRFTEETCALSYWDCLLPAALPSLCWQYKHTHPCRCLSHSWSSVKPKDCSIHLLWPGPPGAALQSGFSFTTTCMNKRVQVQVGDGLPFPPYAVNWSLNILFGPVRTWERLWSVPQPHVPAGSLTPPADGPASLVLLAPC